MTRITRNTRSTRTARALRTAQTASRAEADKILREVAFVLSVTRRVREEIVSDLPPRIAQRMNPVSVTPPWIEALV